MTNLATGEAREPVAPESPVRRQLAVLLAVGALACAIPLFADPYWVRVAVFVFVNIALASSWNVIGGVAGYPSFGQGVFFGLGAYTTAILVVRYGLPAWMAVPGGGVVAAMVSLLFLPLLRQRGFYFALSTFAAALAVETIFRSWTWIRGLRSTEHGWNLPDTFSLAAYFYITLALLVAALASIIVLLNSRVGMALRAIHKDEIVAASAGIDCARYKMVAFVFSAIWPGVFGGVYALFLVYISVETVFDLGITLNMIVYAVFGGLGTLLGPVVGGLALSLIDQLAWAHFLDWHSLVYGVLVVLIVTFSPGGLVSWFDRFRKRRVSS
jgi:branched-chain amino acid transport system permease protein